MTRPRVIEEKITEPGIQDGWIEYGAYRIRVRRWYLNRNDPLWQDEAGNRFGLDGKLIVTDGSDLTPWASIDGLCRIERPYQGGALRPLPYVRRLNQLRQDLVLGIAMSWAPRLRVYAGPAAWQEAKTALAQPEGIPLVVLPPGDDPRAYDWTALGRWRYTRRDAAETKDDQAFAEDPIRAGAGYQVRLYDEMAPVCEDTKDVLAAVLLAAGCSLVIVRLAPDDPLAAGRGRLQTYRAQRQAVA